MDKKEYIKHLKQLIKKYHPDLCTDENLESMYNEISRKLVNKLNEVKENNNQKIFELSSKTEQDYLLYKSGIKYYKNIHPNMFYKTKTKGIYQTKSYKELTSILDNIFMSFNLSEYYFNELISQFPESSWCADAKDKIKLLKELKKRYKNIVIDENQTNNYSQFVNEMGLNIMR